MLTLNTIRVALKWGVKPEDLPGAVVVGTGWYRAAYRVGAFVVKERQYGQDDPSEVREDVKPYQLRVAPTVFVSLPNGKEYSIQPAYTPIHGKAELERSLFESPVREAMGMNDIHLGNIGIDHRNRFVAFDW